MQRVNLTAVDFLYVTQLTVRTGAVGAEVIAKGVIKGSNPALPMNGVVELQFRLVSPVTMEKVLDLLQQAETEIAEQLGTVTEAHPDQLTLPVGEGETGGVPLADIASALGGPKEVQQF